MKHKINISKLHSIIKKNIYAILLIIIAILRFLLTTKLTIVEHSEYVVDDEWVVYIASCLKHSPWCGQYHVNTLVKGIAAPLLLFFSSSIGLSYINFVTLLYISSVLLFIYSIRNIIKNKYISLILYIALLFNPIMYRRRYCSKSLS